MASLRLLLLALIAVLLTACNLAEPAAAQEQPAPTPVPTSEAAARPTYIVQRGTVEQVLEFSGRWLPRDQQALSFEVAGSIRAVNVRAGDTVTAGQVLADFQIESLEEQLVSAELQLETAQLNFASSADGSGDAVTNAAYSLASANLDLESTLGNAPWTNVASAEQSIRQAERSLEQAQRAYNEAIGRADNSASAVDNAWQSVLQAQDQVKSAWLSYYSAAQSFNNYQYSIARAENTQVRAEQDYQDALTGEGVTAEQVQSLRQAQLNVDQIKQDIARSTLVAPSDGVVLEVTIAPGDNVQAYATVITIGQLDPKEVIVNLAYTDITRLAVGMSGQCSPISRPDLVVECIIRRLPLSNRDADPTVRVAATFFEDEAAFGALVNITMPLQKSEDTLWLPPAAIRTFQNRTFVVVESPEGQRVADVTLGLQTDERVEILSGLEEGDVVVAP